MEIYFRIIFFALIIHFFNVHSQELPDVIKPSPIAQQFHKYGDYPVSHFTGVPDITIPIYTIEEDDLILPISLKYHASGIKPSDSRGLVGYGWTIFAGGMISATINGGYDILCEDGFYDESVVLDNNQLFDYLKPFTYSDMNLNPTSAEHEIFSFGINSVYGKFVLIQNTPGEVDVVQLNKKPFKITPYNITPYDETIWPYYFDIIDEKGIQYRFGKSIDGLREGTVSSTDYTSYSWLITDIVSSRNSSNSITFEYNPKTLYYSYLKANWSYYHYGDFYSAHGNDCWDSDAQIGDENQISYSSIKDEFRPVKEINFRNGKICFKYNTYNLLDSIKVYETHGSIIKAFKIVYNTDKFLLKKIEILDENEISISEYNFDYYDENEDFPRHTNTYSVDFWGYYNGRTNPTLLHNWPYVSIINHGNTVAVGDANREADETDMKRHTLHKIHYPTGGTTIFDMGAHKYDPDYDMVSEIKDAGGLRVNSITSLNENDEIVKTIKYEYVGWMPVQPSSDYYINQTLYFSWDNYYDTEDDCSFLYDYCDRKYINCEPSISLSPFGSSVIYPEVTEYLVDQSGNQINKTVYHYDFPFDYVVSSIGTPYIKNTYSWDYGKDWNKKEVYDGNDKLIETTEKYVNRIENGTIHGLKIYTNISSNWSGYLHNGYMYQACYLLEAFGRTENNCGYPYFVNAFCKADCYLIHGVERLDSVVTIKNIDDNTYPYDDGIKTKTIYEYSNQDHLQPTNIITINSKEHEIETKLSYPHDFYGIEPYTTMVDKHIWSPVIEKQIYNNVIPIEATKTKYNFFNTNNLILPEEILTKKGNDNYETRIRYHSYDYKCNVTKVSKEGDLPIYYYWGYNKTYPTVKATNVDALFYDYVNGISSFLVNYNSITEPSKYPSQLSDLNTFNNAIRNQYPNAMIYTYTYKPLIGMTSETGPDGITTFYEYDSFGRLVKVKDQDGKVIKEYKYHYKE